MKEILETYNLINYLKIIDLSLLNLLDYSDFQHKSLISEQNGKIILTFNGKSKKIFESLLIGNINNSLCYNMTNIIVDTCFPRDNWRNFNKKISKINQKYLIHSNEIYIDGIKLNQFFEGFTKKIKNDEFFNSNSKNFLMKNSIKFIDFKNIDICDSFSLISKILSNFGSIKQDKFNYNIINDGNNMFLHNDFDSPELLDEVRIMLISKGVI